MTTICKIAYLMGMCMERDRERVLVFLFSFPSLIRERER